MSYQRQKATTINASFSNLYLQQTSCSAAYALQCNIQACNCCMQMAVYTGCREKGKQKRKTALVKESVTKKLSSSDKSDGMPIAPKKLTISLSPALYSAHNVLKSMVKVLCKFFDAPADYSCCVESTRWLTQQRRLSII